MLLVGRETNKKPETSPIVGKCFHLQSSNWQTVLLIGLLKQQFFPALSFPPVKLAVLPKVYCFKLVNAFFIFCLIKIFSDRFSVSIVTGMILLQYIAVCSLSEKACRFSTQICHFFFFFIIGGTSSPQHSPSLM